MTATVHRVRARNTHAASENRIHDDDVARTLGFRGALVPGVTTWAYLTRPCVDRWGADFVVRGTMSVRFLSPVYEGDEVECRLHDDGTLEAVVDGDVRAAGQAALPAEPPTDVRVLPFVEPPRDRPAASRESLGALDAVSFGPFGFHAGRAGAFLDEIGDDHPLYRGPGAVAHPGWLITFANRVLTANVRLGPWIHTGSRVRHLGAVVDGDELSVRGRVAALTERKGHEIVELDLVVVTGAESPVMTVDHTAIYRIAERRPSEG